MNHTINFAFVKVNKIFTITVAHFALFGMPKFIELNMKLE